MWFDEWLIHNIASKNQSGRSVLPHGVAAAADGADVYVFIGPLYVRSFVCMRVCACVCRFT